VVEQRLHIEVAAYGQSADIRLLPTIDGPAVSPADFSRTPELISRSYVATKRYLSKPPAELKESEAPRPIVELGPLSAQVA
jgi:hypothetical protein